MSRRRSIDGGGMRRSSTSGKLTGLGSIEVYERRARLITGLWVLTRYVEFEGVLENERSCQRALQNHRCKSLLMMVFGLLTV